MINYAHRGASEYAPENTLCSFYLGLLQGANGIETDVQRTKDGHLVLFHDDTVDRVTDGSGRVEDFTLNELKELKVYGNSTAGFFDRIVTFEEFLDKFSCYGISFAVELKGKGVEKDTLELVKKYGIMDKTTFTSFKFDYIAKIKSLDSSARTGWLTNVPTDEETESFIATGGEEIAPKAELIDEEMCRKWRQKGLGIRAWGVLNTALMKKMCALGVDGMTVNFPDRLFQYLNMTKF